jgi:hypothetical protein
MRCYWFLSWSSGPRYTEVRRNTHNAGGRLKWIVFAISSMLFFSIEILKHAYKYINLVLPSTGRQERTWDFREKCWGEPGVDPQWVLSYTVNCSPSCFLFFFFFLVTWEFSIGITVYRKEREIIRTGNGGRCHLHSSSVIHFEEAISSHIRYYNSCSHWYM